GGRSLNVEASFLGHERWRQRKDDSEADRSHGALLGTRLGLRFWSGSRASTPHTGGQTGHAAPTKRKDPPNRRASVLQDNFAATLVSDAAAPCRSSSRPWRSSTISACPADPSGSDSGRGRRPSR